VIEQKLYWQRFMLENKGKVEVIRARIVTMREQQKLHEQELKNFENWRDTN
jgi:hypothetical protein